MPRRKKGSRYDKFIIIAVLFVGLWIAADYYFNVYQHPRSEAPVKDAPVPVVAEPETIVPAVEKDAPALEDGFRLETYRDEKNKFEFQYPVYAQPDPKCPVIEKNDNGFNLGIFSFSISDGQGSISDFIEKELQGMEIGKTENITVAGQEAIRVDYQTRGMGWNGSAVFISRAGKFYQFGILANITAETCGDYADRVYRSVISTIKFGN